jgi:hypothetical protein
MRLSLLPICGLLCTTSLAAQPVGKWPPDSLVNVQVIPKTTPVMQVVGQMRNITGALGVRCQFCHVGEGNALERFDFASDEKRTKLVARQMMRMVGEINRRLDTIPQRGSPAIPVTCNTCHRGLSRPIALATVVADAAIAVNADSAARLYRALRERYFGRDAYDFSEFSLNSAARGAIEQIRRRVRAAHAERRSTSQSGNDVRLSGEHSPHQRRHRVRNHLLSGGAAAGFHQLRCAGAAAGHRTSTLMRNVGRQEGSYT